jgi:type I restriction enzyme S subunit
LVFSRVGSVDRCGYIAKEEEGWLFSGRLLRVRPIEDISSKYLTYHLNSKPARDRVLSVAVGLAMPSINTKILEGVSVALPPTIAEQERIAGALSSIDTLIGALTEQIEKKRHIKQGAMQQLLTGKKRLAGFTGEWKSVKLRELCQLFGRIGFRGYTKNDLVEKGMGAITFSPSDIHNQKIDYSNCDYISFHKYEESPEIKVFNGDIIFGQTASIGKCAIIDKLEEKATINPQFVVLKKFKCNNYFLYYKLIDKPFQTQVLAICGGSTIPTMSQEKLKEQELWFPPTIAEQSAIAAVLSNMDTEIAALEQKRDKYIAIKSGMMQNLLTGKIRLV